MAGPSPTVLNKWYVPYAQQDRLHGMSIHSRTWGDSATMIRTLRSAIAQIDPYAPVSWQATMALPVEAQIPAFFAGVALGIATGVPLALAMGA